MLIPLVFICDVTLASSFSGGDGSIEYPYLISSTNDLIDLSSDVNAGNSYDGFYFLLTSDLDFNPGITFTTNGAPNGSNPNSWIPIGATSSRMFSGTFIGNNHFIVGLYVSDTNADYVGVFGHLGDAFIEGLGVSNSYLKGWSQVGGIAGEAWGTISNCYNRGFVVGRYYVGGIVGLSRGVNIINCFNHGTITGDGNIADIGGIVGVNNGQVINCYNAGDVHCTGSIAVIGGITAGNNGPVMNCYNVGPISGGHIRGGVVGEDDSTVTNCYWLLGTAPTGVNGGGTECYSFTGNDTTWTLSHNVTIGTSTTNDLLSALNLWVSVYTNKGARRWMTDYNNRNSGFPVYESTQYVYVDGITFVGASENSTILLAHFTNDISLSPSVILSALRMNDERTGWEWTNEFPQLLETNGGWLITFTNIPPVPFRLLSIGAPGTIK